MHKQSDGSVVGMSSTSQYARLVDINLRIDQGRVVESAESGSVSAKSIVHEFMSVDEITSFQSQSFSQALEQAIG